MLRLEQKITTRSSIIVILRVLMRSLTYNFGPAYPVNQKGAHESSWQKSQLANKIFMEYVLQVDVVIKVQVTALREA